MTLFELALYWQKQGISTIPVCFMSKDKPRVYWTEYQKRTPTEQELRQWFFGRQYLNIALVCGKITVIDFDSFEVFGKWLLWAQDKPVAKDVAQYAAKVLTSKGIHLYLILSKQPGYLNLAFDGQHCERYDKNKYQKKDMIDVKGNGYIIIPPSVHPSGAQYKWITPADGSFVQVDQLSDVLPYTEQQQDTTPFEERHPALVSGVGLVANIRRSISILDFIPDAKKQNERWYVARCPFHDDKKPSFWIDTERGICNCRVCGNKPMDVINLYARLNHLGNKEAIDFLREKVCF